MSVFKTWSAQGLFSQKYKWNLVWAPGKTNFHIYQTDIQTKEVKIQLKYQVPLNAWRNHDRSVAFLSLL